MPNKAILRMTRTMTRATFEQQVLGGAFEPLPESPGRRANRHWATYKSSSTLVQEREDCFCQRLVKDGPVYSGHTWADVAKAMRVG